MGGHKAIEFTTQALVTAATEVKGVETVNRKKEEDSSKETISTNPLKGSNVFKQIEKE